MIDEKILIEEIAKRTFIFTKGQIELLEYQIEIQPKVGEWIPVSERLPESHDNVLVTIENRMVLTGWFGTVNKCWYIYTWEGEVKEHNVTAWQPLPEPYKEV